MIEIGPLRRPRRTCGAVTVLETATFTSGVTGVVVLDQLLLSAIVVVLLLALVRGVPVPRLRFPGGSVIA